MKRKLLIPTPVFLACVGIFLTFATAASTDDISAAIGSIVSPKTSAERSAALTGLRRTLANDPEGTAKIRKVLDAGTDGPTGNGFKIARNGFLTEAPTLRTFLLDQMAQHDPAGAAAYSHVVLSTSSSPDEWAIALRNLAKGDSSPEARSLLESKTGELLRNASWQQAPSIGYLEAFDTAVYLGGTNLLASLTDLVRRKDNPAVAHASFLALDRLVINNPATTLDALLTSPDSMQGRETTRADYFARADVRDPQQLQILERYLLSPHISAAEISTFANIFPNANYMISPNLLTQAATPTRNTLASIDSASLRTVQQWLADPRFAAVRPSLETAEGRLQQFVLQENQ